MVTYKLVGKNKDKKQSDIFVKDKGQDEFG